jgi:hypothetical protein
VNGALEDSYNQFVVAAQVAFRIISACLQGTGA